MTDRIASLFAWTETTEHGYEGVIAAIIPPLGTVGPLQHRKREIAEMLRPIAQRHRDKTGHIVRLVRFDRGEDLETLDG